MSEEVAKLVVQVESKGIKASDDGLKRLGNQSEETESKLKSMGGAAKIAIASLAGFAVGKIAVDLFRTNIEFDKLNASLESITGSSEDAEIAFKGIQEIAARTPFDVQQVTQSFIKLGALGLAPSERALMSYGNTASAMSKDLNQMIEAVADAATGEFERLKDFGIKAKQQGDNVSFTFQGVTKTIGKNSAEIQEYLLDIGESKFGDAMALQMEVLGGSISNLSDSWDGFLDKLLSSETSSAIGQYVNKISGGLDAITNGISEQTKVAVILVDEMEDLDSLLDKQRNAGKGLFNFDEAVDFNTEIAYQRTLIAGLQKEYDALGSQNNGKTFDEIADSLNKASDGAYKLGDALSRSLKDAGKEASKTSSEIQKLFDNLTAPDTRPDEDINVLDVDLLTLQAGSAFDNGNFDEAVVKAKQAFALLEQMKDAGNIADGVLEYMAENIRSIGVEAGNADLAALEIKIDKEKAAFEMGSVQAEMQAYADENPIKQAVVFEWGAGDVDFSSSAASQSLNAATAAGNSNQLQPMTFNFPDGSVVKNVYADPSGVNQIESYIAREAAKRGSR